MKVYYEKDVNIKLIKDKKVVIIGYGSQGYGHANNLKDSGVDVVIGLRKDSPSWKKVESVGLKVMELQDAVKWGDLIMLLIPDEVQGDVYRNDIEPNLKSGKYLAFAHGFNIHFGQIKVSKDINVLMIAPKGPGHLVRSEYVKGSGIACLIAVHQDKSGDSLSVGLSYAAAIGGTRTAVMETTFKEETETDLFGEQAVLCGGVIQLIKYGFETLVEAGYAPEMAYFECLHEVKLIIDLLYEGGLKNMQYSISNTAEYGGLTRGPRVVGTETKSAMKKILSEIQNGEFAKEWLLENKVNCPSYNALSEKSCSHPIEEIGEKLRSMMNCLENSKIVDKFKN